MKYLTFVLVVAFGVTSGYAAEKNPQVVARIAAECRAVLEENFQAINSENIRALMATTSSKTATPAQMADFRAEAEQMFEATDVYMRVDGFELYKIDPPYAYAYVNQLTLPKNEEDHYPREQGALNFRHHSALLPEHQLVQYKQKFHFENGKWKLHRVLTRPQPVDSWSARKLNESGTAAKVQPAGCKNGKCSTPFIRVN